MDPLNELLRARSAYLNQFPHHLATKAFVSGAFLHDLALYLGQEIEDVKAGRVFGMTVEHRDWLTRVCVEGEPRSVDPVEV